jgi:hypothetical protein
VCDETSGQCVECLEDQDCRPGSHAPYPSPYGVCTADKVCTCWVNEANPTASCASSAECPAGFFCAQDMPGFAHFACLRECNGPGTDIEFGLSCTQRAKTNLVLSYVWAPVTTCHAFTRFSSSCLIGGTTICSVDGVGGIADGTCTEDICTYSCWDGVPNNAWCRNNNCDIQFCKP